MMDLKSKLMKVHWQHRGSLRPPTISHKLTIISIDPGVKNYGFRVEDRYSNGIVMTKHMECIKFPSNNSRYRKLIDFLDSMLLYIKSCHLILIEGQYWRSSNASRISQHTITYFMLKTRNRYKLPLVIEVNSRLKTSALAGGKQKNTKQWAIKYAKHLLNQRLDDHALEILDQCIKKDDISDTIVQAEAVVKTLGLSNFLTKHPVCLVIVNLCD